MPPRLGEKLEPAIGELLMLTERQVCLCCLQNKAESAKVSEELGRRVALRGVLSPRSLLIHVQGRWGIMKSPRIGHSCSEPAAEGHGYPELAGSSLRTSNR